MKVYIISYFGKAPKDSDFRNKRIHYHNRQIDWLNRTLPNVPIRIFAQRYYDDEYIEQDNIEYAVNDGDLLLPGPARNKLLDDFYNSDHEWCLFLDNDAALWEDDGYDNGGHGFSGSFINFFLQYPEKFNDVDCFYPIDGSKQPFNALWRKRNDYNHIVFQRGTHLKTSLWFYRNKKPLYFDESFTFLEDREFAFQLISEGMTVYNCQDIVLHDFGSHTSTVAEQFKQEGDTRRTSNDKWGRKIADKYKHLGLKYENSQMKQKWFMGTCWRGDAPKELKIKVK